MTKLGSSQDLAKAVLPSSNRVCEVPPRLSLKARAQRARASGFSLVEIMIAMGVVSFSFVTLMGLLGVGTINFHNANTTSITTQIAQRVINEAQQSDFANLISGSVNNASFVKAVRYFDDAGNEIVNAAEFKNAIYQVNTRITPTTVLPQNAATTATTNICLATVTVQVANNPSGATLATESAAPLQGLWSVASTNSISTFSTFVSKNN